MVIKGFKFFVFGWEIATSGKVLLVFRLKNKSPQALAAGDFLPKPYHKLTDGRHQLLISWQSNIFLQVFKILFTTCEQIVT